MSDLITAEQYIQWAKRLTNYSLGGIVPEDTVMIVGERVAWSLMEAIEKIVIKAGAVPDVMLVPPNNDRGRIWSATMAQHGTTEQIEKRVPGFWEHRFNGMTKYIEIMGAENPDLHAGLPQATFAALLKAHNPFVDIRLKKPWVLTLHPTQGFADLEDNMSLAEYTDAIVQASLADPKLLMETGKMIGELMRQSRNVSIRTKDADSRLLELRMSIMTSPGMSVEECYGRHNWPDGEVFTSPDSNSVDGEIFLDMPVMHDGTIIQGIYLRLVEGKIVEHDALLGKKQLTAIIETDDGSHRLGELALGLNLGFVGRELTHPLFVEKVGGTLHIAIGKSYDDRLVEDPSSKEGEAELTRLKDAGVCNTSAQHVDIVADFREGGHGIAVEFDDTKLQARGNNGDWVVA